MQPVRLTIYGDFWDSQIYKGRLYLWSMDNTVHVYDWEALVDSIARDGLRLPLVCAFSRGDVLYVPHGLSVLFEDQDMRMLLEEKFYLISQSEWTFTQHEIERFLIGEQGSPFDALHDDSSIYLNRIYGLTDTGLHSAKAHKPRSYKFKVDRTSEKLWDGLGTALQAKSRALAIAAAGDGLFELHLDDSREPTQLSKHHTLFVNWAFASIYGSSDVSSGHLAAFRWATGRGVAEDELGLDDPFNDRAQSLIRELVRIVDEEEIFGPTSQAGAGSKKLSWGNQDKLYRASSQRIEAVHFTQQHLADADHVNNTRPFDPIGKIEFDEGDIVGRSAPISGSAAYFGVVVEYEDVLVVVTSDNQQHIIPGPVTRWRVFPRSVRYENHLHVILDNRLEIWSFNNDYFVNQRGKTAGIEFTEFDARRGRIRARP